MYNNYNPYYNDYNLCPYSQYFSTQMHNPYMYNQQGYPYPDWANQPVHYPNHPTQTIRLKDYGPDPFVVDIEEAAIQNNTFRTALWTGKHLQLTLMSINVGEDIGLEVHPNVDQFIRIERGQGLVMMGNSKDNLNFRQRVEDDYAIFIPAGKWHNIINTGRTPLKLYSIYAPPEHPHGTVHKTKQEAEEHH